MNTRSKIQNPKSRIPSGFVKFAAVMAVTMVCAAALCASDRSVLSAADKAKGAIPKSVFVNEPNVGRDPFFPNSTRRKDTIPRVVVATTNATPVRTVVFDLKLKGIAGTKEQRLALINSVTVAEGELADVKCHGGQVAKIRCREIREDSVIIELVPLGEVRELKLREGI